MGQFYKFHPYDMVPTIYTSYNESKAYQLQNIIDSSTWYRRLHLLFIDIGQYRLARNDGVLDTPRQSARPWTSKLEGWYYLATWWGQVSHKFYSKRILAKARAVGDMVRSIRLLDCTNRDGVFCAQVWRAQPWWEVHGQKSKLIFFMTNHF